VLCVLSGVMRHEKAGGPRPGLFYNMDGKAGIAVTVAAILWGGKGGAKYLDVMPVNSLRSSRSSPAFPTHRIATKMKVVRALLVLVPSEWTIPIFSRHSSNLALSPPGRGI
jgi:hypothetical protein